MYKNLHAHTSPGSADRDTVEGNLFEVPTTYLELEIS